MKRLHLRCGIELNLSGLLFLSCFYLWGMSRTRSCIVYTSKFGVCCESSVKLGAFLGGLCMHNCPMAKLTFSPLFSPLLLHRDFLQRTNWFSIRYPVSLQNMVSVKVKYVMEILNIYHSVSIIVLSQNVLFHLKTDFPSQIIGLYVGEL